MEKITKYEKLVHKIKECKCCENIKRPMFFEENDKVEFLSNFSKRTNERMANVNIWNYWQGSLNAKIMLIGQDFGTFPKTKKEIESDQKRKKEHSLEEHLDNYWCKEDYTERDFEQTYRELKKTWEVTDVNLYVLFKEVLGYDLTKPQKDLFFTNMACCYRQNRISGSSTFRSEWLSLCANKYMGELINIIQPEVIITLGENAFNALCCIEEGRVVCKKLENIDNIKSEFAKVIACEYELEILSRNIKVFPVYHPGAYSTVNRKIEEQKQDWRKIKDYLEQKNSIE